MNIILFGPPGSGKGTQSEMICTKFDLLHISTGDILRDEIQENSLLGKDVKSIVESGKLVSDEIILEIVSATILSEKDKFSGYLFDGFPRNINQVKLLATILSNLRIELDIVLLIEVNQSILLDRILNRKNTEGRVDDNRETLSSRLQVYASESEPIIKHYTSSNLLKKINGEGEINEVNQRINLVLEDL